MGLDVLEIVLGWESAFGFTISDREFAALRKPSQAIDFIAEKLGAKEDKFRGCLSHRAFNRIRHALTESLGVSRRDINPQTCLSLLMKGKQHRKSWSEMRRVFGFLSLPGRICSRPKTVGDLTHWVVNHEPLRVKAPGEPWTRLEIRTVVRGVLAEAI